MFFKQRDSLKTVLPQKIEKNMLFFFTTFLQTLCPYILKAFLPKVLSLGCYYVYPVKKAIRLYQNSKLPNLYLNTSFNSPTERQKIRNGN